MSLPELSFSQQVANYASQLGRGRLAALGCFYDLTSDRLLRYARTLTRNSTDAEDALQATLVRIAQHPQHLANANFPWAYCLRIVRNEVLKMLQRRPQLTATGEADDVFTFDDAVLERAENAASVRSALQQLPREQAEVVVLKIWEEMTFAEIAVVLSESPNTVASRYRYAIEKLTRLLEPLAREAHHA